MLNGHLSPSFSFSQASTIPNVEEDVSPAAEDLGTDNVTEAATSVQPQVGSTIAAEFDRAAAESSVRGQRLDGQLKRGRDPAEDGVGGDTYDYTCAKN